MGAVQSSLNAREELFLRPLFFYALYAERGLDLPVFDHPHDGRKGDEVDGGAKQRKVL